MVFRVLLQATDELGHVLEQVQPWHLVLAVVSLVFVTFVLRMWVKAQ